MKKSVKQLASSIVVVAGLLAASASQAAAYDATIDFQTAANPGAVWSYGYSAGPDTTYTFTAFDKAEGTGWTMAGYNTLGTPAAWVNSSGVTQFGVANGQLSLHPGPVGFGDLAILRFTADHSGDYNVAGQFYAGDIGSMSGAVVKNGQLSSPLQSFASTDDSSTFAFNSLHLNAGQTLDFVVGNNGSFYYGNTPVSVTIQDVSAVPEPETYAMLMAGLGLVGLIARRKRAA
jgi:hypothetical protein